MVEGSVLAIYVLSTTGSTACFGAGYSVGRLVGQARAARGDRASATTMAERDATIGSLQSQLTSVSSRCGALDTALAEAIASHGEAASRLDAMKGELAAERQELGRQRETVAGLEREITELRGRLATASGAASVQRGDEAVRLELGRARSELQRAERDLEAAKTERRRAKQSLEEAELVRKRLQQELATAQEAQRRLQGDLELAEQARRRLEAQGTTLDETARLREQLAGAASQVAELAALREALATAVSEREDLEARQGGAAAYVRRAQEAAHREAARATALEREIESLRLRDAAPAPAPVSSSERVTELERELAHLRRAGDVTVREETRELRVRISQLEPRAAVAERLEAENQALRDHVDELVREASEVTDLRRQATELQARLFALGEGTSAAAAVPLPPSSESPPPSGLTDTGIGLARLLALPSLRCVVVADVHGLPVDALGEADAQEGLAAITGLAGHLAAQARQLLPLAELREVTFRDRNAVVVACHLFDCHGDAMALATLGSSEPPSAQVEQVVASVRRALFMPGTDGATMVTG